MPPAIAVVRGCYQTSAAQTGTRFRLQHWRQLRPASFYEHRYPLSCKAYVPPGRERRACCGYLNQGHGLSPLPQGEDNDAQLFAQTRTLRIRQVYGIDFSTGISTSPLRAVAILTRDHFHKVSRAVGPQKTGVQHAEEADLCTKMFGIACDFEKCFCTGSE